MAAAQCIERLGAWEGYELEGSWEEQRGVDGRVQEADSVTGLYGAWVMTWLASTWVAAEQALEDHSGLMPRSRSTFP